MFDRHELEVTGSLCMILTLFEGCLGLFQGLVKGPDSN